MVTTNQQDKADTSVEAPEELPFNEPLSHELFLSNSFLNSNGEFDASAFLLTRKHISLDDLRKELRLYLNILKNKLISIINNDYEDFINLGGSHLLGSEDQMSIRMRKPLENIIYKEIKDCKETLVEIRFELSMKLKKRDLIRKRKLICRKLLAVNDQVNKVEEMLFISNIASTFTSSGDAQDSSTMNALSPSNALVARNNNSNARRVSPSITKKVDR